MTFKIREAVLSDLEEVAILMKESAPTTLITGKDLARDAFSSGPSVHILVTEETQYQKVIGYSLYFYTYSMWKGKAIHLENLYVQESMTTGTRHVVGEAMMAYLARVAEKENLPKICFESNTNQPIEKVDLHKQRWITEYGAEDVTLTEHWHLYHFGENVIKNLAKCVTN